MTRRQVPDQIKVIKGTFRKDRQGEPCPPVEMPGSPVKPADLGDVASKFWDDHVPQLVAAGVAREVDAPELALMCQWWAESQRIHAATPDTSIEDEAYYRLIQLGVMADKNFRALADKFGLNPQDRGKLRIKTTENKSGIRTRKRA